jgi:hypothetical protein
VKKIKAAVAEAVAVWKFFPVIKSGVTQPQPEVIHIVFGASQPHVQVSLKKKISKKTKTSPKNAVILEAFAIHITSDAGKA